MWSSAVETALADAFRFAGGFVPDRGLVLGRGGVRMRTVRLVVPFSVQFGEMLLMHVKEGVHLYSDSSAAPLLDLRRRLKAIMDVLDGMIRHGVSLSRSVELLVQWDRVLDVGPLGPFTQSDYLAADLYCRLSDFIHRVVVHRRDVAITAWRSWLQEDPLFHPYKWLRHDLVPPAPFLQCDI